MIEAIEAYLAGVNHEFAVFIVSMLPIIELRGAIPFGISLGLDWWIVFALSVLGNILPVPFIIMFFRPIIDYLENTKLFGKFASKIKNRTKSKVSDVTKYKMFGLFLFVAIPLPGTGAWTGAAIAAIMKMRIKHSLPAILVGVLCAGVIMTAVSCGVGEIISHFF